jgi:hypothetical protein
MNPALKNAKSVITVGRVNALPAVTTGTAAAASKQVSGNALLATERAGHTPRPPKMFEMGATIFIGG